MDPQPPRPGQPAPPATAPGKSRGFPQFLPARPWLLWCLPLIGVAAGIFWLWPKARETAGAPPDPRLTFATPYQNVRPQVKYVGDDACTPCHADIAASYDGHPMGQSAWPIDQATAVERFDEASWFEAASYHYAVEKTPGGMRHHERLLDANGEELFHASEDIAYAVGSGAHGRSYLVQRGQQLYQSPITWFAHDGGKWDLSPGYADRAWHFDRPIIGRCLFCHANQTQLVPGTWNTYAEPVFRGSTIGCERCHGPGELHVRHRLNHREDQAVPDHTIVNPRHLSAELRDDVCAQCHLLGEQRTLRRGRRLDEYRPGLPLPLFDVVFVRPPQHVDYKKSVGHFEQLAASKCYEKSAGALGCISCHDPHRKPGPEKAAAVFRKRCLNCHGPNTVDCSTPLARRQQENGDSCIACHMPRSESSNIVHIGVTDHRIPRRALVGKGGGREGAGHEPAADPALVMFQPHRLDHDEEFERDLGIALIEFADVIDSPAPALQAQQRLAEARLRDPHDHDAAEAHAQSLIWRNDFQGASAVLRELLERAPRRETALFNAAVCAQALHQPDEELAFLKRLRELNPTRAFYATRLAQLWAERRDWKQARAEAEHALRLSPAQTDARRALIQALFAMGERDRAQRELTIYEAISRLEARRLKR